MNFHPIGLRGSGRRAIWRTSCATGLLALLLGRIGTAAGAAGARDIFGVNFTENFGDKFLMLGTGPADGAFRPISESLCDAINEDRQATQVRCVPVGTAGSTFNLHAVANQAIQLGMAQEDLPAHLRLEREFEKARTLRVIAVLHSSSIAVMVRKPAGITGPRQIAG